FQRLLLGDLNNVGGQSWLEQEDYQFIAANRPLFEQRLSLYEIAQQTGKNTLQLATLLQPLVNAGAIQLHEYELPSPEQQLKTSGPLIACIDDSKATQQIVKMTLESIGYRVINVVEPAKALTTFVRQRPALILMDINMPEIDGYELCSMFQKSTLLRDIPIVMLTGRDGLIDRIRARMVGAVNFIAKPFSPQELVNLVQSHLTGHNE
ncbi:MAG: response regulator, partial [Chloroflexaceae bacterium]|nr:response regulator [Chloroflexaceae bacterium]